MNAKLNQSGGRGIYFARGNYEGRNPRVWEVVWCATRRQYRTAARQMRRYGWQIAGRFASAKSAAAFCAMGEG